jgi:hypothetical protein
MPEREVLQDDPHRQALRVGDTVRRPMHPWSTAVHELLRHLADVGFPYSPRVLGVDEAGREVLTYIAGDSGPAGWAPVVDEAGLVAMARLLREYHDAVQGFRPSRGALWAAHTGPPQDGELICHGDFGPWNLVWHGTRPVGILDWDYAWPHRRLHDVAYALEYVAPFRDDHECVRWLRYPAPPDRRRRLAGQRHSGRDGKADRLEPAASASLRIANRGVGLARRKVRGRGTSSASSGRS